MDIKLTPEVASAHKNLTDLCEKFEASVDEFCALPLQSLRTQDFYESECVPIAVECSDALSKFQSARSYEVTAYERRVAEADDILSRRKLELEEAAAQRTKVYHAEVAAVKREFSQQRRQLEKDKDTRIEGLDRKSGWIDKDDYLRWAKIGIIPSIILYWILGGASGFHDSGWDVFFVGILFGLFVPFIVAGVGYLLKKSAIVESERRFTVASKVINDETDNLIASASAARYKKIEGLDAKRDKKNAEAMEADNTAVASASAERAQHINTARSEKDQAIAYIEQEYQVFDTRLCQCIDKFQAMVDTWTTENANGTSILEKNRVQSLVAKDGENGPHLTRIGSISIWDLPERQEVSEHRNNDRTKVNTSTPNQSDPEGNLKLAKLTQDAESGNVEAQYQLAVRYKKGQGVDQNDYETKEWYQKAAEQGHADAQYELGFMFYIGWCVDEDRTESAKWYRKAAEGYRKTAEQGDAYAQFKLGNMYRLGEGVPKDDEEAAKWYRKAAEGYRETAEQGDAEAQYLLGNMYRFGLGVPKDEKEAAKWYRKAAEQGNHNGEFNLGQMYYNGIGMPEDREQAVKWLQKAAEQENTEALTILNAEQGDPEAQDRLGDMYHVGNRVPKDDEEAAKWYRKAVEGYRKAAEQGDAYAQFKLAYIQDKLHD